VAERYYRSGSAESQNGSRHCRGGRTASQNGSRHCRVGLGVSGGADSTALLVLMAELQATHGFEAVVLHVDHGLRKESAADAEFVKRLARRFGLPFRMLRTKVVPQKGESLEMAARRVRLGFFAAAMKREHLDCIATGHQMEDVAETFLLRLARASGADGLAGLKPVSFVEGIVFIRPLLNVSREDLRAFLRARGIAWREDSTNADTAIPRNKVRHVVLPFLARELDPKIVEHICRSASYLREGAPARPPRTAPAQPRVPTPPQKEGSYLLSVEPAVGFRKEPVEIGRLPASAWLSADALRGRTLAVRKWRPGDWMKPCGFPHRRKLQDIFITAKTPPAVRHALPIVADGKTGEVLWIPGYRVSDAVKVASADAPSIRLSLQQSQAERKVRHGN